MLIEFVKMNSGGNDFVIIDNRKEFFKFKEYQIIAKKLCERRFWIGADGVIFLERSKIADAKMSYYNSDGSRASMCGNGLRCLSYFCKLLKIKNNNKINIETDIGILPTSLKNSLVKAKMISPKDIKIDFELKVNNRKFLASFLNTGVPHTIIFIDNIKNIDVKEIGRRIRFHPFFSPEGTNVNFIKKINKYLFVRTYERGVENETFSCGTGVVASSIVARLKNIVKSPVLCKTLGGEIFKVYSDKKLENIYLEGKVNVNFFGRMEVKKCLKVPA